MDNLFSGLLGAVLGGFMGGLVALVAVGRQIHADRRLQRRDELSSLIAHFWGACDALWVAQQDLGWAIVETQIDRQNGDGVSATAIQRRHDAFVEIAAALKESRQAMALMRLLHPQLVGSAENLVAASKEFRPKPDAGDMGAEFEATRQTALSEFEQAARALLQADGGAYRRPSERV